jgi:putative transcriptional regulator
MKPLFNNQIRVYRAMHKMSQEDLAKKVRVRRETIGNLEIGRYNPSLLLAMDIASVFNVSIEDVFQRLTDKKEEIHGR